MQRYTENQVKQVIKDILKKDVEVCPVGNHEINRHLVYHVTDQDNDSAIFKLYYKRNRWKSEVASYKVLRDSNVKAPTLLDTGILPDGTEWILIEYLSGETFDKVRNRLSENDQKRIIGQMGEELGKIHSLRSFDFFGPWDENCNPLRDQQIDFKTSFIIHQAERRMKSIYEQKLPEEELFKEVYLELQKDYNLLEDVNEFCLCCSDFGPRNVLVDQINGQWELVGIIDFEHSFPWDTDSDLVDIFHTLFWDDTSLEKDFLEGYRRHKAINESFYQKKRFYMLNVGLAICSWAKIDAPDYYQEGIKILHKYLNETK